MTRFDIGWRTEYLVLVCLFVFICVYMCLYVFTRAAKVEKTECLKTKMKCWGVQKKWVCRK